MLVVKASESGYAVNRGQLPLVLGFGLLTKGMGHAKASHCLFGVCGLLRDIKKTCNMNHEWPLVWENC